MSLNKVQLIGYLGADPDVKYTQDKEPIVNLNIATNEKYKKGDETITNTEWHRVTFFGSPAKFAAEYLKKGRLVYIEGRLKTDKYDKNGETKYTTYVKGSVLEALDSKSDSKS
jgi:single-strand DNA-binding protein